MLAKSFEDLEIWKMAREIVKDIYQDFSSCKDFDFRNQINRAGISIMNNIDEIRRKRCDHEKNSLAKMMFHLKS